MFSTIAHALRPLNAECAQFIGGCVCTTDQVLRRAPQLQLMRDAPTLAGKQARYSAIFHFADEEGRPAQSLIRARALSLPEDMEFLKTGPQGWGEVYLTLLSLFKPGFKKENIYVAVPVDERVR